MGRTSVVLLILFALAVGVVLLQIYLAKRENRWLGLILPLIALCISVVAVMGIAAFTVIPAGPDLQVIEENGIVIQAALPENLEQPTQSASSLMFTVVSVFLLYNIPTAVLLAIYFGCRERQRQRKALEKMQVQDLE